MLNSRKDVTQCLSAENVVGALRVNPHPVTYITGIIGHCLILLNRDIFYFEIVQIQKSKILGSQLIRINTQFVNM